MLWMGECVYVNSHVLSIRSFRFAHCRDVLCVCFVNDKRVRLLICLILVDCFCVMMRTNGVSFNFNVFRARVRSLARVTLDTDCTHFVCVSFALHGTLIGYEIGRQIYLRA